MTTTSVTEIADEIVIFDVSMAGSAIYEFATTSLCITTLVPIDSHTVLIKPEDMSHLPCVSFPGGVTRNHIANSKTFSKISSDVFEWLNEKIWACIDVEVMHSRIRAAFDPVKQFSCPKPKAKIDIRELLKGAQGQLVDKMTMHEIATHYGVDLHPGRSLNVVRVTIEVLKRHYASLLFQTQLSLQEKSNVRPRQYYNAGYIDSLDIDASTIKIYMDSSFKTRSVCVSLNGLPLKVCCKDVKILGREIAKGGYWNVLVELTPRQFRIFDHINNRANRLFYNDPEFKDVADPDAWRPLVRRSILKAGRHTSYITLKMRYVRGSNTQMVVKVYRNGGDSFEEVSYRDFESVIEENATIDAFFTVDRGYNFLNTNGYVGICFTANELYV